MQEATVTPCVGVWIETVNDVHSLLEAKSHPAWVCGLKQMNLFTLGVE